MNHPEIRRILEDWRLENPYRDLVDREDIRLIDHEIGRTVDYIRMAYDPGAEAETIEPLSGETGLQIYRVVGKPTASPVGEKSDAPGIIVTRPRETDAE